MRVFIALILVLALPFAQPALAGNAASAVIDEPLNPVGPNWQINQVGGPGSICLGQNVLTAAPGVLTLRVPAFPDRQYDKKLIDADSGTYVSGAGAEVMTKKMCHYGYYEIKMKSSETRGVCNGFFIYGDPDGRNEIDIEFLSDDNSKNLFGEYGYVHFTVHLPARPELGETYSHKIHYKHRLRFAPWKEYHTYGFSWSKDEIRFFVDGRQVNTRDRFKGAKNVVQNPGYLMINNWSNGGKGWSGGPPEAEALMHVARVKYTAPLKE